MVERVASINTVNQADFWIGEFHKEYGYFPAGGNRATVAALKGDDTTANPRQKLFFYIQKTTGGGPVLSPAVNSSTVGAAPSSSAAAEPRARSSIRSAPTAWTTEAQATTSPPKTPLPRPGRSFPI